MFIKNLRRLIGTAAIALSALVVAAPQHASAQMSEGNYPQKLTLVIGGGLNWNMADGPYNPDGRTFPPTAGATGTLEPKQGEYNTPEFHIGLEIPVTSGFMFAPRLNYNDLSAVLDDAGEPVTPSGTVPDADALSYAYRTVGLDLMGKITFGNFHLLVGPNIGIPVKNSFARGQRTVQAASASTQEMPDIPALWASIGGGAGYDIPLTPEAHKVWLTPEVMFHYPLTNLSGNEFGDLIVKQFRGAVSLKFDIGGEEAVVAAAPVLASVDIIARGVRPDGSIAAEPVSPTSSMHARSSMPLLPYVFFENGKSDIPARYSRQGSTGFSVQSLAGKNAEDANHAVLDIVGQRLKENPQASLTITGTNSNTGAEKGNVTLSRTRAQQVRDYLVNTWGIEAGRVTVDARNLPEIPTNPATQPGMEENRRVELASNDSRITAPIKIEQRETMAAGETIVRFETTVQPTGHPFTSWRITLDQNGSPVGQALSGSGTPPAVQTMTIANATNLINQPLRYRLEATDAAGKTVTDEGMTRIVPATVERSNLEKFAMLSFDFDRSDINERARQMLELISESISRDARVVKIDGFTDFTGTEEYNQNLSEARANSAVTSLRSMTTLPAATNVTGHGERDPKFNNDLPEGRQLNRRVEFTIEKSSQ
jgi:outer membrane protein OmpA-like peptidoglycan-associated protein